MPEMPARCKQREEKKGKDMKKRITSLILAAVMVLVLIPAMALSATAEDDVTTTAQDYSDLYVQDGLTMLLTSWSADDTSVDLVTGKWTSKVGGLTATILGGMYDASSNPVGWRRAADGSIFYRMHSVKEYYDNSTDTVQVGVVLPDSLVNDTDTLTMEAVFLALGIATEDGTQVPHTGANGEWRYGAYSYYRSAFTLGGAQLCQFFYSTSDDGASMHSRIFYAPGAWGSSGVNGTKEFSARFFGDANGVSGKMDTLMFTRVFLGTKDADGKDEIEVTLKTSLNSATVANDKTKWGTKIAASQIVHKAEAFMGFPAQVYAIRVYNRVLTDAERNQNHFADLANYFGLDVANVQIVKDKAALFASFADKDFTADKAELQALIDSAETLLTYDGIAARLVGNSGIRSLWSVDNAAIQALEDAGYTVSYGAIMGLASQYATSSDLTVEEGAGKAIVTVYNGGAYTGKILARDDASTTFAYTTIFDGDGEATKVNYERKLVYRGFVTVTKGENTSTFYVDMAGETFPATGASCLDVAAYFLANGYADSEVLKAVKAICEAE